MCGDFIDHKLSHPILEPWNWNMLVGSSSTKSNLVASSFGKTSFQHMNRMVREDIHPRTQQSHMWLGPVLFDHTDTSFCMRTAPILVALFRLAIDLMLISDRNVTPSRHGQCDNSQICLTLLAFWR